MIFKTMSKAALIASTALLVPLAACSSNDTASETKTSTEVAATDPRLAEAASEYAAWVRQEADALVAGTKEFTDAYIAGDNEKAKSLYAPTRAHWEAIEPVAEKFGDLDPKTDAREADLAQGQAWTGWHLIEKDLWQPAPDANGGKTYQPLSPEDRTKYATMLNTDVASIKTHTDADDFPNSITAESIANGSKELLDEVANGKITGEEEIWSHTDLWDFQANITGAKKGYDLLRPVVVDKDPKLAETLDARFAAVQELLDSHKEGDGFVLYTALTQDQIKALSKAVEALGEPLSKLAAAVKQ
ncbi:iron uptake system protein EfeO [Smaragdicoccus niigatensis]|uniref:iron uptake system protein EfeO n=1 Tax=Smaragdicoccus niigatensis TaxID=359359 RepID=UPI000367245C|nr:iron uptake system protein EfeO [Smaragdicoccus niigatensis]